MLLASFINPKGHKNEKIRKAAGLKVKTKPLNVQHTFFAVMAH